MIYTVEQLQNINRVQNKMKGKYLTEKSLGEILKALYPNSEWIHDKKFEVPVPEICLSAHVSPVYNFRPDYCCHELKLCVEFDGPNHYTSARVIAADGLKDITIANHGYKVIRVPYFVQLDTDSIKYFFDIDVNFDYGFKHGFICKQIVLPADFCEQGVWKLIWFLSNVREKANKIREEIIESLYNKINSLHSDRTNAAYSVLPSNMIVESISDAEHNKHDNISNLNKVHSTLQNNWNCVVLESSQVIKDLPGAHNFEYSYNSAGNISGYSFTFYYNQELSFYTLLIEPAEDENYVNIIIYKNDNLVYKEKSLASEISLFSLTKLLPADYYAALV